jgi:hypothetical protein
VFFIDEELGIEMKNQMRNIKKGKSDIAIQLNGPAARLGSGVFVANNGPLNISTIIFNVRSTDLKQNFCFEDYEVYV